MATVSVVNHRVADFAAWKRVYDSVAGMQKAGGVKMHSVLQSLDDPNLVTVLHFFDSAEAAKAFFAGSELRDALGNAGVDLSSMTLSLCNEVAGGKL